MVETAIHIHEWGSSREQEAWGTQKRFPKSVEGMSGQLKASDGDRETRRARAHAPAPVARAGPAAAPGTRSAGPARAPHAPGRAQVGGRARLSAGCGPGPRDSPTPPPVAAVALPPGPGVLLTPLRSPTAASRGAGRGDREGAEAGRAGWTREKQAMACGNRGTNRSLAEHAHCAGCAGAE
ncbi:mitogen-activated protein kinase 7-like [Cavia porcellus]|uniref:mitogen-activated protein kinase 7-like n=1 Tax=Cavia porcellus TaxID=10141 RepID=UPI002FE072BF